MKREDGYEQIIDEEGYSIKSGEICRYKCCDCGLIHEVVLCSKDENDIGIAMRRLDEEENQKEAK